MSYIKESAMTEPLVDCVNAKAINSTIAPILSIDITKVTKEELDFMSEFEVKLTRNDYVHGFVCFFDVQFSACHTNIGFSTGPRDEYTHWKQTVFYLDKELLGNKGETVSGTISTKRNPKNPRDLDIQLTTKFSGKDCQVEQDRLYRLR
jgi:protein arginine N-methyltransferase 1